MRDESMTTLKLLWGMTWRGGAWGLLAGTFVGATFGALFGNVLVFGVGLMNQSKSLGLNDIPTAIAAVFAVAMFGMVIGALFGVPTGFVVGIMDGLLIGVLTRALFYPLKNVRAYRWTIAIVSAVFTSMVAWVCFLGIALFYSNRNSANVGGLMLVFILPALVAGIAAGFISRLITRWSEMESTK
jgi:hypothetical protein